MVPYICKEVMSLVFEYSTTVQSYDQRRVYEVYHDICIHTLYFFSQNGYLNGYVSRILSSQCI